MIRRNASWSICVSFIYIVYSRKEQVYGSLFYTDYDGSYYRHLYRLFYGLTLDHPYIPDIWLLWFLDDICYLFIRFLCPSCILFTYPTVTRSAGYMCHTSGRYETLSARPFLFFI